MKVNFYFPGKGRE